MGDVTIPKAEWDLVAEREANAIKALSDLRKELDLAEAKTEALRQTVQEAMETNIRLRTKIEELKTEMTRYGTGI